MNHKSSKMEWLVFDRISLLHFIKMSFWFVFVSLLFVTLFVFNTKILHRRLGHHRRTVLRRTCQRASWTWARNWISNWIWDLLRLCMRLMMIMMTEMCFHRLRMRSIWRHRMDCNLGPCRRILFCLIGSRWCLLVRYYLEKSS